MFACFLQWDPFAPIQGSQSVLDGLPEVHICTGYRTSKGVLTVRNLPKHIGDPAAKRAVENLLKVAVSNAPRS